MLQQQQFSNQAPAFSIIIAVYNDWAMLQGCLQSLARQHDGSSFEVIVVDDGSTEPPPEFIRSSSFSYPLVAIQQPHSGIPAARNTGIRSSKGAVLLFVDADSRLQAGCLAALGSAIANAPQHDCFQLRLVGNGSNLVGRAEEVRLITFQQYMLQPDGRIRYLNIETGIFDPTALRAEDTLLLADLMQAGELPLFVTDAIVEHYIPLSLAACFRKDIRSAYLEGRTNSVISSKGVKIRLTHPERLRLLAALWETARQPSIGRSAWFVVVGRQALLRTISFLYRCLRVGARKHA